MPFTKYTKWDGVDWESLSLEDLLERLADFLLQSGFQTQYSRYWGEEEERTLEALRDVAGQETSVVSGQWSVVSDNAPLRRFTVSAKERAQRCGGQTHVTP